MEKHRGKKGAAGASAGGGGGDPEDHETNGDSPIMNGAAVSEV